MKLYHYFLYIILALGLTTTACDEYLDIQPKGEIIPETAADYEAMLNDAQLLKASSTYPVYLTDDVFFPEKGDNDYVPAQNTLTGHELRLYTFDKEVFGDSEDDEFWFLSYNRIYYYNVVINNIMKATEAGEEKKRSIKAEALMGRAFEYLNLVNAYAPHYNKATAATDPGVPLVLDENIGKEQLSRATVQQVYDRILADLVEAEPYLPAQPKPNAFRASKPMGLGMLARLYLYMGDYPNALHYANQSLAVSDVLLNLNQHKVVNPLVAIGRTDVPELTNNPENIFIRLAPYTYGVSAKAYASEDLLSHYTDNDMRLQLFFSDKFFGLPLSHKMWMPWLQVNLAMSTSEMYLIAAESEARIGNTTRALTLLNKLRDNRIANNTPLQTEDAQQALKWVLEERRRELAMQGLARLIDIKRLNLEPQWAKHVVHSVAGTDITLPPNSPKLILPIPGRVLRFNPGMPPNQR